MKRIIKLFGVILFFSFMLVGCSNSNVHNNSADKNISKSSSGIIGKVFSGKAGVANADGGHVEIHFISKDRAVVIESGKYIPDNKWGRMINDAKYKTVGKNKIKLTTLDSTNEVFANKSDMQKAKNPVFVNSGTIIKSRVGTMNLSKGKDYVSLRKDKLNLTDGVNISSYKSYVKEISNKYYGKDTKLSDRGFMSPATEMLANNIAFKGSRFIWQYGGPDNEYSSDNQQGARLVILTGSYELSGKNLILHPQYNSSIFQGTIQELSGMEFQKYSSSKNIPNKIVFKFTKNSTLHLVTKINGFNSEDMLDYGTVEGTPKFTKMISENQPDTYTVGMKRAIESSDNSTEDNNDSNNDDESFTGVKDVFPTKEDFANWLTDYYKNQGDYATEDSPGFHITGAYEDETLSVRMTMDGEQFEAPSIYSASYSLTPLGDSDSDISRTISIEADGSIFSGHFNIYNKELTSAYGEYMSNH